MIARILRRVRTEWGHFRALSVDVRRLLFSYALYLAAYPLIVTFVNAYLWRITHDLWSIVMYNTGYIVGLPIGFYVNGLLLRKFRLIRLYLVGAVFQGITTCLVIFAPTHTAASILILGTLYGFGAGLYWANKNYISLQLTRGTNRIYFNSIEEVIDIFVNIVVPAAAGWFIALSGRGEILASTGAYRVVVSIGFLFLFLSGIIVQPSKIADITIGRLFVRRPSRSWWTMRAFNVLYNTQVGVSLAISSVLVLVLVGGEEVLGTLQSATAILAAIGVYIIGRKSTISQAWKIVGLGSLLFLGGSAVLAGAFSWVGALSYSFAVTVAWVLQWSSSYAVSMELMDSEEKRPEAQYAYVCDNELFFNIGRGLGIAIVVGIALSTSQNAALQWSPLIIGIIQLPLAWLVYRLAKNIHRRQNMETPPPYSYLT